MPSIRDLGFGLVAIGAALMAAGCAGEARGGEASPAPEPKATSVVAVALAAEPFRETLELRGTALADMSSILNSEVGGVVAEILVARGEHVRKGQALVLFDKRSLALGAQQAGAAVEAAEAQAKLMRTELARTKQLVGDGAAPGSALDQLSAQGDATGAQVRMARAAAGRARKALADSAIRAPYDGVITEIFIERGEMATVMPPKPVVQIADIAKLQIQAFVPEDAGRLAVIGADAEVEVEAAGAGGKGTVAYVSSAIVPGVRTFEIRIEIDNPEERIKAGALARVRVLGPEEPAAILVPMGAVLRDGGGAPYVVVAAGGTARWRPVRLGPTRGARVLVQEGLRAGELLVIEGASALTDGQPIAAQVR